MLVLEKGYILNGLYFINIFIIFFIVILLFILRNVNICGFSYRFIVFLIVSIVVYELFEI